MNTTFAFEYCCLEEYENKEYTGTYLDEDIDSQCLSAWEAFKRVDFDLDRFFLEDCYLLISDDHIRCQILVECLGLVKPISDYIFEWMDCYLDFGSVGNKAIRCGKDNHPVCDDDIFKYLYFCRTDEEIWDMLAFGIGNIETLFLWYMGIDTFPAYTVGCNCTFQGNKDEAKAKRMINYILTESPYTTDEVQTEILKQMRYDDLTLFINGKEEGIKRYKKRAEIKNVDSLWDAWRWSYMSEDPRLREEAVKYQTKAVEMTKSIFENDDIEEELEI